MALFRKLGLLLGLVCLMGFYAHAQSPVTLYFTTDNYGTNIWKLTATSPSGADSTTIASNGASTTGWYHLDPGLTDSTADASEPSTTHPGWNAVWVSESTYNGNFASGNWVFTIRKTDSKSNRVGVFHADIYRSSSSTDQTNATFIGHCSDSSDDWTGAAATITATCAIGTTTTLTDEYIVVRTLNQVTTGNTSTGTWTMIIKDATNGLSKLVTPNYAPARQDVNRAPANHTVTFTTGNGTQVGRNKTGATTLNLACTTGICKDQTLTFSEPTVTFTTGASVQRALQVTASASLNINSGNPTGIGAVTGGTDHPKSASGSLNLACTNCIDLQRSFLQPTLDFRTQADAVKNSGTGQARGASANLAFATNLCIDRTQNVLSMGVGVTTKATFCLERSFPGTTLTFTTLATAVSSGLKTRSVSASLNLATADVVQRVLHQAASASVNFASSDARLANRPRTDMASMGLNASVATLVAKTRTDSASLNLATTLARLRNVNRSDSASVNLTTSIATQRVLHVNASASINLVTGATGVRNTTSMPWFRGAPGTIATTTSVAIQRGLHVIGNASLNLATSDNRVASRGRTDSSSFNLVPVVAIQRELHVTNSSSFNLQLTANAVVTHTTRRRVMIVGAM